MRPTTPGQPRRPARLPRAFGLDGNPLRRTTDRAEAWIRVGLLTVFLVAGPQAALAAGHWAYHAAITDTQVQPEQPHRVKAPVPQPALVGTALAAPNAGRQAGTRAAPNADPRASARASEVLAAMMTLTLISLALLAALRLTLALLNRRRLAAWEAAWSKIGPQWSAGTP